MFIDDTTPIAALTVADLKNLILSFREESTAPKTTSGATRYVYGLQGIREIFNCSHATAQRYKDTILKDVIIQNGRKIIVDVDRALKLFNERRDNL